MNKYKENPQRILELLKSVGIIESNEGQLTAEFYRNWKRLEISLSKMSERDKARHEAWAIETGNNATIEETARMATIVAFFPQGLEPELAEACDIMVQAYVQQIPAWKVPESR